jgi:hypothetical protein
MKSADFDDIKGLERGTTAREDGEDSVLSVDGDTYTFGEWLAEAGRRDSASQYDMRAAWRAGEDPAEYRM